MNLLNNIINEIVTIIRLCSPFPDAPRYCEIRMAINKLITAEINFTLKFPAMILYIFNLLLLKRNSSIFIDYFSHKVTFLNLSLQYTKWKWQLIPFYTIICLLFCTKTCKETCHSWDITSFKVKHCICSGILLN